MPTSRPFQNREGLHFSERQVAVGSLRYWDRTGSFAATVAGLLGCALPGTGECVLTAAGYLLAWRSPTETLLLEPLEPTDGNTLSDRAATPVNGPAAIAAACANATDGCLVDMTGGINAFVASGARVAELLSRLGNAAVPAVGQSRVGRLADLTVCTFSIRKNETWLLVERVYAAHLRGWIEASFADLSFGPDS